jgi:F-type H+-transporting ATPase subunit delta
VAELATIARPYAEALFKAVSPADAAAVADQVGAIAAVAGHPQLRAFADDPKVRADQVFDVVVSLVKEPWLGPAAKNLLRTMIDNGRLAAVGEVAAQFRALVNASSGEWDATIQSAFPIEPAQLAEIVAKLEQRFGRKLKPQVQLDPSLIGGIRVVVGDEVLDTSVKARLQQMKVALTA